MGLTPLNQLKNEALHLSLYHNIINSNLFLFIFYDIFKLKALIINY